MKKFFSFLSAALFIVMVSTTISCKKDDPQPDPAIVIKNKLIGKTWEAQKVVYIENGIPTTTYVKGGANNEEDYSLLKLTFKADGSMVYIDEEGAVGDDVKYILQNSGKSVKFSSSKLGLEFTAQELTVNTNKFSYKVNLAPGFDLIYTFIPTI